MQYDMHYYGTYAMAAAAGISREDAEVIATSSQFVDDQNRSQWILALSTEGILGVATAHHPLDAGIRTILPDEGNDTRSVWVPFHFIPGAEGETFRQKMVCRKNSEVVNAMLDYYLLPATVESHKGHALSLMGIASHVYADTFSHYGFSGLSDPENDVDQGSIMLQVAQSPTLWQHIQQQANRFAAQFAATAHLGHGAVLTHPDRPYLMWSFQYLNGERSVRNNPATFLEGCQALYERFCQFAKVYYGDGRKPTTTWAAIAAPVKAILDREGAADERARFWLDAMQEGQLGPIESCTNYDSEAWIEQIDDFARSIGISAFQNSNPYRFFVAADYHRNYVLKRLLPQFGLVVA